MLKKHYYVVYSIIGYATALCIFGMLLNPNELKEVFTREQAITGPLLVSLATLIYLANYMDTRASFSKSSKLWSLFLKPVVLFLMCGLSGCFVNYLLFKSWSNFLGQFIYLTVPGIPAAIIVSLVVYFFVNRYSAGEWNP